MSQYNNYNRNGGNGGYQRNNNNNNNRNNNNRYGNNNNNNRFRNNNNNYNRNRSNNFNRRNNRTQGFNNRNNRLPELAPPPLTYENYKDRQKRIKLTFTLARMEHKVELPIFDDTNAADYLRTLKEYHNLLRRFPQLTTDGNAAISHHLMLGALRGEAQSAYIDECEAYEDETPSTIAEFGEAVNATSQAVLGVESYNNQITYLKKTKKPANLSVDDWFRKIKTINKALEFMAFNQQQKMDNSTLLREVVFENIPPLMRIEMNLHGGEELNWTEASMRLTALFQRHNMTINMRRNSNSSNRRNNNNNRHWNDRNSYRNN